jgi:serine phosphatase RsbU (regulator of sigma subunit)
LEDNQNKIWFQTKENGVLLLKNDELNHYTTENNLVDNHINKTFIDSYGNVWFVTNSGISKYSKMLFEIYDVDYGLLDNNVTSVCESKNGKLYIGSYGGLSMIDKQRINNYLRDINGTPLNTVLSLKEDYNNNLLVGTFENLFVKEKNDLIPWSYNQYNSKNIFNVFDLAVDNNGDVICAADYRLIRLGNDKIETIVSDEQYPDIQIYAITIDNKNNYWLGTSQGVIYYNNKTKTPVKIDEGVGLANSLCYDIVYDSLNSRILVGTNGGVSVITEKQKGNFEIKNITTEDGLKSNIIYLIAIDKNNDVWIGHDKGLNKIDHKTQKISYYSDLDGFYPMETYMGAIEVMHDGNILFGTVGGLVKYIAENEVKVNSPPKVYITGVSLYNDTTDLSGFYTSIDSSNGLPMDLILPYDKNNLVFNYVGIHFTNVKKNKFKYMLENYDNTWSEPTSEIESLTYRKIPPGTYTFKVLASNCDGVWTKKPVEFTFTIKPPFWQTTWFYALVILLAIGIFYMIIVLRVRKLKHDKKVLEEKVQERTIQIRKQRDQIAHQNREITDSIQYAQRIQSAVLPNEEIINKLLSDYFILFKPRDIVSGDFYWINGQNNKVIVVAADCTGHGVPGAFMSMLGISLLNEIVQPEKKVSAAKILNELRKQIKTTLSQTGKVNETKDGMDLALAIIDYDHMKIYFSGAYNPLVHIRKGEMNVYKGDKMPIGIHVGKEIDFSEKEIDIKKNDCIYMFSDGYADQFGGPDEKKFMSGKFKNLLQEINSRPMDEQKNILNNTIEEWKGNLQQVDDILIVGVRI